MHSAIFGTQTCRGESGRNFDLISKVEFDLKVQLYIDLLHVDCSFQLHAVGNLSMKL